MAWNSICVEVFAYSCISNFYIFMLDFFTRFIYFNTVVGMLFYIISTMNRKPTAQRIIGLQNRCTELLWIQLLKDYCV